MHFCKQFRSSNHFEGMMNTIWVSIFILSLYSANCEAKEGSCEVNPESRVECGYGGITKETCEGRGCCFNPNWRGVKWCYKQDTSNDRCMVNPESRIECGWPGITKQQCESKPGCCFNNKRPGMKWCYKGRDVKCAEITCSSWNYKDTSCSIPDGLVFTSVALKKQYSRTDCRKPQVKFSAKDNKLLVTSGCRGLFAYCYTDARSRCNQPRSVGRCRARHKAWYFDSSSKSCKEFYYGGCGGNSNRFKSLSECVGTCGTKPPAKEGSCEVNPESRVECGYGGITKETCEGRGCCFNPNWSGVKWCYKPDTSNDRCMVNPESRIECGWPGITKQQCESKPGCCFNNKTPGMTWCYKGKSNNGDNFGGICQRDFNKIGCFNREWDKLTDLLITDLDPTHANYTTDMNWEDYSKGLHSLACRCREKAVGHYKYFAIGFHAECLAGKDDVAIENMFEKQNDAGHGCINGELSKCDKNQKEECAGEADYDFFYEIVI